MLFLLTNCTKKRKSIKNMEGSYIVAIYTTRTYFNSPNETDTCHGTGHLSKVNAKQIMFNHNCYNYDYFMSVNNQGQLYRNNENDYKNYFVWENGELEISSSSSPGLGGSIYTEIIAKKNE